MSYWPGKYVIGLTGNIATGKSVVRRMLEHLGAYTIDLDALSHRLIAKGTPGHQQLLDVFGKWMVGMDGEIDRAVLSRLVFRDPRALAQLNSIIHQLVRQEVGMLVGSAHQSVIAIEATGLLEGEWRKVCDTIWVTDVTQDLQVARLMGKRAMSRENALRRVQSQSAQSKKVEAANVVLENTGSYESLWEQVATEWKRIAASADTAPIARTARRKNIVLQRGNRHELKSIAAMRAQSAKGKRRWTSSGIMATFSDKTLMYLRKGNELASQTGHHLKNLTTSTKTNDERPRTHAVLRFVSRKLTSSAIALLIIAYLTLAGLLLAERGRQHLPAEPLNALGQAAINLFFYIFNHPSVYHWSRQDLPVTEMLGTILTRSFVLLSFSLGIATILGLSLGIYAALSKKKTSSGILTLLSVLGVSTPSFLLAMLFWIVNIQYYRITGNPGLPSAGFGWDGHMIMPMIVLAMRPMAQIAQVTYVTLSDILQQDYVRTAHAKGLPARTVQNRHALRNVLIPILTTVGTSLRFSLASLPVVELFFEWPGIGLTLIDAIRLGENALVVDLILSLGLFFLLLNVFIEFLFPLLDPRLLSGEAHETREDHTTFTGWWRGISGIIRAWIGDLGDQFKRRDKTGQLPPIPKAGTSMKKENGVSGLRSRAGWTLKHFFTNPSLILGGILAIGLLVVVFYGPGWTATSPYQTNGVMIINDKIAAPPFAPSSAFPWGSDYVGRDIQALVLNGAKQTLSLAFFCMLARMVIGATLGALAGWQRGSWLDQWVMGAVGVWAAFPVTLFAVILIQALGIQQGMWVFVAAISIVGWGEVAQFVRGQVAAIKPLSYIESARSVGARSDQIMGRHVLPNLVNSLIVLATLEMGGIMMLLAELGYLDTFMGGGFQAMIGEVGRMIPVIVHYSDVPEWAALIANIRQWWRSYPWMALYPGLAFFLSILAFNLFGEGLRRFLDESQINLSRLFNKYTLTAMTGGIIILSLTLQSASPLGTYREEGSKFNSENVIRDIATLSQRDFQGRETGTAGADAAAEYIAERMEASGLLPAGEHGTYFLSNASPRPHLTQMPVMELLDSTGGTTADLTYRKDFAEIAIPFAYGETERPIRGLVFGAEVGETTGSDPYGLRNTGTVDHTVIIHSEDLPRVNRNAVDGILVIEDETYNVERKDIYPSNPIIAHTYDYPIMVISTAVAERLLATAGSSLEKLEEMSSTVPAGAVLMTEPGATIHMSVFPERVEDLTSEKYIHVIGVLPGEAAVEGQAGQVIMVSAYYDGLGRGPDGTLYPGANDNASGVAMLIELARLLKETPYRPDKTVLFVAWAGGERWEGLSVVNIMNARPGGLDLAVTEVLELSGVGYGSGDAIALGEESSYRLVKLFQAAAKKYDVPTTTRGRNPHYGREGVPGFGDRKALTLTISWDGADELAHTPRDLVDIIDPEKLSKIGRTTLLSLLVLSREAEY